MLVGATIEIENIILNGELGVEPRVWHTVYYRLGRLDWNVWHLRVCLNTLNFRVCNCTLRLQCSEIAQKLCLVSLTAVSPSEPSIFALPFRSGLGPSEIELEKPVPFDVPSKERVEKFAVNALFALFDVMDPAEENAAPLVYGN